MRKLMTVVAVLALSGGCGSGCKKKRNEEGTGGPPMAMAAEPVTGSQPGTANAATKTPQAMAQRYEDCWAAWNASDWQKFGDCFSEGAVVESPGSGTPALGGRAAIVKQASTEQKAAIPDLHADVGLVLVNGATVVGVVALHGHADKTPVGILFGTIAHFDDTGTQIDHEWAYLDMLTLVHQLTPDAKTSARAAIDKPPMAHAVMVARDDAAEHDDVRALDAAVAAYNKHDAKAWGEMFADDVVFADESQPTDHDKKAAVDDAKKVWQAMSDARMTTTSTWAAGDYVAAVGTFDATSDHDSAMHAKTGKKASLPFLLVVRWSAGDKPDHGKIKEAWLLYQSKSLFEQLGWDDRLPKMPSAAGGSGSSSGSGSGSGTGSGSGH